MDKRNKCKKRRAVLVVVLIAAIVSMVVFLKQEYRYADRFSRDNQTIISEEEKETPIIVGGESSNQFLKNTFSECKKMVEDTFKAAYPYLNWDMLDEVTVSDCDPIIELKDRGAEGDVIVAEYYNEQNIVLVVSQADTDLKNAEGLKRVLLRELIHCLTYSDTFCKTVIYEGVSQEFTKKVCSENKIQFKYSTAYEYHAWLWQTLQEIVEEENLMWLSYHGLLNPVIDHYTKNGYAEVLMESVEYLGSSKELNEKKKFIRIAQDVLLHFAKNYVTEQRSKGKKDILSAVYEKMIAREKYFENILK